MPAISLEQISLWRRTQEEFSYDLKKTILSVLEGKYHQPAKKLVLDQVDLTIEAGDKVGIIGVNGSGKSTLLKVICGILQPTKGQVKVWGKIAPLIELEAGFDHELTVLDNIILYGVMLGFSQKQMRQRISSILAFAELEEYVLVPLKALSSGMVSRLGFAIATDVQPDILILDEVLAVGDERFKKKCKQRLKNFWDANATVLLVSHELSLVEQFCDRVIWLDKGKIKCVGSAGEVIDYYRDMVNLTTPSLV
jgi:ABC-type polysaccharide/polyol phosphate transport system ATPase subunit